MFCLSRGLLACFLDYCLAFFYFKRCISETPTAMKIAMCSAGTKCNDWFTDQKKMEGSNWNL